MSFFRVECRVVDLANLLTRPEGKTLEFKRDFVVSGRERQNGDCVCQHRRRRSVDWRRRWYAAGPWHCRRTQRRGEIGERGSAITLSHRSFLKSRSCRGASCRCLPFTSTQATRAPTVFAVWVVRMESSSGWARPPQSRRDLDAQHQPERFGMGAESSPSFSRRAM